MITLVFKAMICAPRSLQKQLLTNQMGFTKCSEIMYPWKLGGFHYIMTMEGRVSWFCSCKKSAPAPSLLSMYQCHRNHNPRPPHKKEKWLATFWYQFGTHLRRDVSNFRCQHCENLVYGHLRSQNVQPLALAHFNFVSEMQAHFSFLTRMMVTFRTRELWPCASLISLNKGEKGQHVS